jgi:hypothetical protein
MADGFQMIGTQMRRCERLPAIEGAALITARLDGIEAVMRDFRATLVDNRADNRAALVDLRADMMQEFGNIKTRIIAKYVLGLIYS